LSREAHRMQLPREVVIGRDVLKLTGEICKRLGYASRALTVAGPRTYQLVGGEVENSIRKVGFVTEHRIVEESKMDYVDQTRRTIRDFSPNVVLGVGGGKVIDVAKLSSTLENAPFISVPTTASHDGIASPRASIKDLSNLTSVEAQSPIAIIADTSVIAKAPHRLIASGCGDLVAKYTAVRDWMLGHKRTGEYYGDYAASLSNMSATLVTRSARMIRRNEEEGIRVVLEALLSCGVAMSIAGSSRPCSGSEHAFSHALDLIAPRPALHGEQCGVGAIMMSYLHGGRWEMVKRTLSTVGAPTTARQLNIEPRHIIEALVRARTISPSRYTVLNEKILDEASAADLAKTTGIIDRG